MSRAIGISRPTNTTAGETATFSRRAAAFVFDWYVGALVTSLPIAYVAASLGRDMSDQAIATFPAPLGLWAGIAGIVAGVLYYVAVPLLLGGQTAGKRLLHVRVVAADGDDAGIGAIVVRQLVGIMLVEGAVVGTSTVLREVVSMLTGASLSFPLLVAGFVITLVSIGICGVRHDRRALHDLIAGTKVVDA